MPLPRKRVPGQPGLNSSTASKSGIPTFPLCGVDIAALTPEAAAEVVCARALAGGAYEVHLCNAYTLSLIGNDEVLNEALTEADLNLPDGTPVAWLGRRHGARGPVRGPGLVTDVMRLGLESGLRHYLYGGAEGVAEHMQAVLKSALPGLQVVGRECPPWRDLSQEELRALADRVIETRAQVLWIGLGTPRQDYLVHEIAEMARCTVVPVGAAFDFLSGRVKEAPESLHGSGLEWIYRLAQEPGRLWRRYFLGNPRFVVNVIRGWRR